MEHHIRGVAFKLGSKKMLRGGLPFDKILPIALRPCSDVYAILARQKEAFRINHKSHVLNCNLWK